MKLNRFKFFSLSLAVLILLSAAAKTVEAYSWQFADESGGVRLRWKTSRITVALSASLFKQNPAIKPDSDVAGAIRRSFEAWEKVANVKFETVATDKQTVSAAGKSGDGISLLTVAQTPGNLFMFGGDSDDVPARTRTYFNGKGNILEADIVLNSYQQFSTDGSIGTFDLEAALTHEIGHLLGLEHSSVVGATMFEHQGKNGIYGLSNFSARTLAEDDVAGARALYGARDSVADCCGTISGKLFFENGKTASAKDAQIWIEEAEIGRVAAAVSIGADDSFRAEGLRSGRYSIYAQNFSDRKNVVPSAAQMLGASIEVGKGKVTNFTKKIKIARKTFDVSRIGFNSQISDLAVPLNDGKSFLIYVGGRNLDADNFVVGFNSPFLSFVPNSLVKQDFGSAEMSFVSFEVKVNPQTPAGEYSFYVQSKNGETAYSVGGLTVEDFVNPWSNFAFSGDE